MKRLIIYLAAALALGVASACTQGESVSDRIIAAEDAVSAGDDIAARDLCDRLLKDDHSPLAVEQLGRMSMVYMRLAEASDDTENIDLAARCFRRAFQLNADSARAFYSSLPHDQDRYVMQLASIVSTLDHPVDIRDDAPSDSVCSDFESTSDGPLQQ